MAWMDEDIEHWAVRYFTDNGPAGGTVSVYRHASQEIAMRYADSLINDSPSVLKVVVEPVLKAPQRIWGDRTLSPRHRMEW